MGLYLNYELRLAAETGIEDVRGFVYRLHALAVAAGFEYSTLVRDFSPEELSRPIERAMFDLDDLVRLAATSSLSDYNEEANIMTYPESGGVATAFGTHPGAGCEGATFGFSRPLTRAPGVTGAQLKPDAPWYWCWYCKTQYASVVSDEHLIHCHLGLVSLLDAAREMGIDVTVHDETHYWETRDAERLLSEVREMNRLIARFAGGFHDTAGHRVSVESPIFKHPDFERLESEA